MYDRIFVQSPRFGTSYSTRNILPTFLCKGLSFGKFYSFYQDFCAKALVLVNPSRRNSLTRFVHIIHDTKAVLLPNWSHFTVVEIRYYFLLKYCLKLRPRGFRQCLAPSWFLYFEFLLSNRHSDVITRCPRASTWPFFCRKIYRSV